MFKFIRPEFFDIFGIGVFSVITIMSSRTLFLGAPFPHSMVIFLFVIGILGIIVDGTIVVRTYTHFFKKTGTPPPPMVK